MIDRPMGAPGTNDDPLLLSHLAIGPDETVDLLRRFPPHRDIEAFLRQADAAVPSPPDLETSVRHKVALMA